MDTGRPTPIDPSEHNPDASESCLAIMYHYIRREDPIFREGVIGLTPEAFESQLDLLCAEREPIDWPSLVAWTQGRGTIPRRSFLLTFDDGLIDHTRVVLPILDRRGLRGTFFVSGATLDRHGMLSAHAIHLLLAARDDEMFQHELLAHLGRHHGPTNWAEAVDPDAARRMYAYEPPNRAWLKYLLTMVLPRQIRDEVVLSLFEKHIGSSARWAQHWYLDWDDLWAMQAAGHTIGGHGFSHEPLARLSPSEQRRDVGRMASILTEGLGRDIRPFSYPYGSFDSVTGDACRDAGFIQAFTTCGEPIHRDANVMSLPRIDTIHVEAELQKERAWAHA